MAESILSAPILSTPDTHILADIKPVKTYQSAQDFSEDEFRIRYEIDRTLSEIRRHKWQQVALQFPDDLLPHSAHVFQILSRGMTSKKLGAKESVKQRHENVAEKGSALEDSGLDDTGPPTRFTILADTSYGSCCVDEIAAEHINADAVIHYGRACLSPTARLPVLHVFTSMPLDLDQAKEAFVSAFPDPSTRVVIMADIPYTAQIESLTEALAECNYDNLFATTIVHDPSSAIPNRTIPQSVSEDASSLSSWHIFHIAEPPTALLLNLSSRVASIRIFSVKHPDLTRPLQSIEANTTQLLRRRYALVTSMSTVSVWGILINTLSVKNYLHVVEHVKKQMIRAGRKFYLFVVGKINAAKVANFSEIEGWVIIGCWESSLIDSKDFFRPILTPFELEMALMKDEQRVWSGAWSSNFQDLLDRDEKLAAEVEISEGDTTENDADERVNGNREIDLDSEDESAPPEFDLRTGRLISRSMPVQSSRPGNDPQKSNVTGTNSSNAMTRRARGDIVAVNGIVSPAGEYLKERRTWKGLGSDFEIRYDDDEENVEGGLVEEGRSGIARGYSVGDSVTR